MAVLTRFACGLPDDTRVARRHEQHALQLQPGQTATLGSLAAVDRIARQTEILRENLQRAWRLRPPGRRGLGHRRRGGNGAVDGLQLPAPFASNTVEPTQEQQESFHDLLLVLLLALVLVFGVLLSEFRTFPAPVAILAILVLSTSGVFWRCSLRGSPLTSHRLWASSWSSASWPRMASFFSTRIKSFGPWVSPRKRPWSQAGRRRLRPITMTALAAVGGMLPLALALGAGSQMLQPLAIAVIGGILISMILSASSSRRLVYFRLTEGAHA